MWSLKTILVRSVKKSSQKRTWRSENNPMSAKIKQLLPVYSRRRGWHSHHPLSTSRGPLLPQMLRDHFLHSLTDCLKNNILKKFRNYLRPTSDAIYTLKETSSDLGLKRWNEPTVPSEKMVLDLAKSVKEWLRYWRFKTVDGFIHLQKFPFTESEDLPGSGSGGPVEDGLGTSTSGPGSHLPMPAWKFLI